MIYLNNAATSYPKPRLVSKAILAYLNSTPSDVSRAGYSREGEDIIALCRQKLAELFRISNPNQIVLTSGATESLNLAIKGLCLERAHVITTSIEHNSVLRPLKTLERQGKITLSIVDCNSSGFVPPDAITSQICAETRAIVMSHCSNVTGTIQDVKTVCQVARCSGITTVIDCSQSAGAYPIDVTSMDPDLMAFAGHKWLWGLPGIGGLYVREGLYLEPLKTGDAGVRGDLLYQSEKMPYCLEAGTPNLPGIASLVAGVDTILGMGLEQILNRHRQHRRTLVTQLRELSQVSLYAENGCHDYISCFSFNINGVPPADVSFMLENSFGLSCRAGLHGAPLLHRQLGTYPAGTVRVSPSYFTSDAELGFFVHAIKEICRSTAGQESQPSGTHSSDLLKSS